jgi:hypothetical protein
VLRCLKVDSLDVEPRTGSSGVEFVRRNVDIEVFLGGVRRGVQEDDEDELFRINLGPLDGAN